MRWTFPVQAHKPSGFSLIESIVALAVATLITMAAARALIGSLKAEQTAERDAAIEFAAERIATRSYLALPDADIESSLTILFHDEATSDGGQSQSWKVWSLQRSDRPSLKSEVALRVNRGGRAQ